MVQANEPLGNQTKLTIRKRTCPVFRSPLYAQNLCTYLMPHLAVLKYYKFSGC